LNRIRRSKCDPNFFFGYLDTPIGKGFQGELFAAQFDILNDLKNGSESQNVTPIFYWIFGCLWGCWSFRGKHLKPELTTSFTSKIGQQVETWSNRAGQCSVAKYNEIFFIEFRTAPCDTVIMEPTIIAQTTKIH